MCDDDKTSCDLSRQPVTKEPSGYAGLRNAQYSILGSQHIKGSGMQPPEIIARGLDLPTARAWCDRLYALVGHFYPGSRFFNCPMFGMELRLPEFTKNGVARAGDIVLRPFATQPALHQGGHATFVEGYLAGQVSKVNGDRMPVECRDRTGVATIAKPYFVFPAEQFDLALALAEIRLRDSRFIESGAYGALHGSYGRPDSLGHALREYLVPMQYVPPSCGDVSRIMGFTVTPQVLGQKGQDSESGREQEEIHAA